ncbi:MAG: type I methionyl aminopeptidase [Candidatus Melainabacteria bacterium]|nr:type I methionyl aminopeptidase [Candidatus Melainabacteria bacterium]
MTITIYEKEQYKPIKEAGRLAGLALDLVCRSAKAGISTWDLDKIAEEWIRSQGAIPTFKGYLGFPASLCTSVNHEVVHGIPSKQKILMDGDIISLDIGVTVREKFKGKDWGYIGDTARTVKIGSVNSNVSKLLDDTELSLYKGIECCKVGKTVKDISASVNNVAQEKKYGVVRMFGGHGIGPDYHSEPFIPNWPEYFSQNNNTEIKAGMLLCIEPMFNLGSDDVRKLKDDWTIVTADHKISAHFEHTILVTEDGSYITTKIN